MRKKVACIMMALAVGLLTACQGGTQKDSQEADTNKSPEKVTSQEETDSAANSATEGTEQKTTEPASVEPETLPEMDSSYNIVETVMYDGDAAKITAKGLKYYADEMVLELELENKSDAELSFLSGTVSYSMLSINGYMIPGGYLSEDVPAKTTQDAEITISYDNLSFYGISAIADVEISLYFHGEDYNKIYTEPCKMTTELASTYDYEKDTYQEAVFSNALMSTYGYTIPKYETNALIDKKGCALLSYVWMKKTNGELMLVIEYENKNEESVSFYVSDIKMNDFKVCTSTWATQDCLPGKRCIETIEINNLVDKELKEVCGFDAMNPSDIVFNLSAKMMNGRQYLKDEKVAINYSGDAFSLTPKNQLYDKNQLSISYLGIVDEETAYCPDVFVYLYVENNSANLLQLSENYSGESYVNDEEISVSMDYIYLEPGEKSFFKIRFFQSNLEDIGVLGLEDITNLSVAVKLEDMNTFADLDKFSLEVKVK